MLSPPLNFGAACRLVAGALALGAVLMSAAPLALAQVPPAETTAEVPASDLQKRADHIRDLIAGKLDVGVAAADLFNAGSSSAEIGLAGLVLKFLDDPKPLEAARKTGEVDGYPVDVVALALAQADFLALPAAKRDDLLSAHARKIEAANAEQSLRDADEQRLNALKQEADALEAFLNRQTADLPLLSLSLLDPDGIALDKGRRERVLGPVSTDGVEAAEPPSDNSQPVDPVNPIESEQQRVDELRARLLATPAADLASLFEAQAHAANQSDIATVREAEAAANQAALESAAAAAEALQAATEVQKLIAHERSRLLGVREAQARFEADLAARGDPSAALEEETLRWRREIRELQGRSRLNATREIDAENLYSGLVDALKNVRARLAQSLGTAARLDLSGLSPPKLDTGLPEGDAAAAEVRSMRVELLRNEARLRAIDEDYRIGERNALYSAMVDLNEARLNLIPELSASAHADIVGFGQAGIAQVARELNQITLIWRYNLANLPGILAQNFQSFVSPTPDLIFALVQIALLSLMFRFWRRNGDAPILKMRDSQAARQPPTIRSAFLAAAADFYQDIRRPVEWLALALTVRWILQDKLTFFGENFVWTVLLWLLFAAALVQIANRFSQSGHRVDPRAEVRLKSLKLLAGVGAGVGLILSITASLVGQGAIHNWVLRACWLVAPVVVVLLAYWWRERILTLSQAASDKNPVLRWAATNPGGIAGHIARCLAGAVLLSQGVVTFIKRRLNDIALVRDIADQRRRKQAAAQAAADVASGQYAPISEEQSAALDPHRRPLSAIPETRSPANWAIPDLTPGKVLAVVGERGLGKSTAVDDLVRGYEPARVLNVRFAGGGYAELIAAFAAKLHVEPDEGEIIEAIAERRIQAVVVDDFQRLFVPAIGGLRDFDKFVAFARSVGAEAAWIFAIGGPAMTYISRARSDHAMFDEIWRLPRWTGKDLRALIERRTAQAGIEPQFDISDEAALGMFENDVPAEERARRSYFDRLCEMADGNPAIALDIWRRSLFANLVTGKVEVRTFSAPPAEGLLSLPDSTFFVLRAFMQMEVASTETVRRCTDLDAGVVAEAVRRLVHLKVIGPHASGYRISLYWYREVGRILERQNLMVRAAA